MKVFVEQEQLPPVRIRHPARVLTVTRTPSGSIPQKDAPQPTGQFVRYLTQVHEFAGAGRAFHLKVVAIKVVIPFQGFDEQIVER